jgi:hypothetical protein
MDTMPPVRSIPAPNARVRMLLARAHHQQDTERFWSLAVAMQLIEDHLAQLHHRASLARGRSHHQRAQRAQEAWKARLRDVYALLER